MLIRWSVLSDQLTVNRKVHFWRLRCISAFSFQLVGSLGGIFRGSCLIFTLLLCQRTICTISYYRRRTANSLENSRISRAVLWIHSACLRKQRVYKGVYLGSFPSKGSLFGCWLKFDSIWGQIFVVQTAISVRIHQISLRIFMLI